MVRRLGVVSLLLAVAAARGGSLSRPVLSRVTEACVLVQAAEGGQGQVGSGFFVGRNEVLTNHHVVAAAIEGDARVAVVIDSAKKSREVVPATILDADEELDLALLHVEHRAATSLRFLRESQLRVTQAVWCVGYPFGTQPGLEVTVTAGTISSLRKDEEGELRQVQIDASINPGNSGGPVVDDRGNVAGITRAVVTPKIGAGMAIAIPCGAAEAFVDKAKRFRARTQPMRVLGKSSRHGLRVLHAEKVALPWGTTVQLTLRGDRDAPEAELFTVEITSRRREVLKTHDVEPTGLRDRQETTVSIRLKDVDFDDVSSCRIVD